MKGSVQPLPSSLQLIHCIIDLKNVVVKFKKRKTDHFRDIKFNNGVLEVPRIIVDGVTKSLLFNFIAFELCHMDSADYIITSYVVFMDNLINSGEDVSHLHSCGIIENCLGNDAEVADLFNGLCREVAFDIKSNHMSQVHSEVNTCFKHRRNAWSTINGINQQHSITCHNMNRDRRQAKGPQCRAAIERAQALAEGP
ncbi:hypothetical protein Dimus_017137 [Dionaea muscipula]